MAFAGNLGMEATGGKDGWGADFANKYGISDPFGDVLGFEKGRQARELNKNAVNQFNIETPDIEAMKLELAQLVSQGELSPEQAQTYLAEKSQMSGISLDPRLQKAQEDALMSLQDIAQNKGITDMDRAQLAQIQAEEDTAARGQREAILQNAAQRGMASSGMSQLAQLQNAQEAATRKSARDTSVAGMAQQRALQALAQAGQLGGQMQQADFGRQAQVAEANDAINRFNTQNKQQVALANTGARNEAAAANLASKQGISNKNVELQNAQQQFNKGLGQQEFENQAKLAQAKAGAMQAQAQGLAAAQKEDKNLFGSGAGAVASIFSDEKLKTDFENFDASAFLDSLTPSKYRYKDSKHGQGMHAGPMAQDLEKTDVGRGMVKDTPEGKKVDYGQGFSALLASLVDVHQRLKNVEGR